MASEVDICNLALSHLGDPATIASLEPPEGSAQAEHCARFYPIARDTLLEMPQGGWSFATRRANLAQLNVDSWSWQFAYAYPASCMRILAILPYSARSDSQTQAYETESAADGTPIILTNTELATCRYVARVNDSARFPAQFVDALARLLASYLAGELIKGESGRKAGMDQLSAFNLAYSRALQFDANQRDVKPEHVPGWIGAR